MEIKWKQWRDVIFWGSRITADDDCSQEIKRHLLLGRKAMTNLDSVLKSKDITLSTKVCIVKAIVFPVVMYRCELDHKEIWAPKNWCFQTVEAGEDSRESLGQQENQTSQSSRKIVLNIHWKDWCWSWSSNTLATWCKEPAHWKWPRWWERFEARKGHQRMRWLDSIIDSMHMSLSKLKRQWRTGKPDMLQSVGLQSWTRLSNCTTW